MAQRRNFNRTERNALFLASDGKCSNCGAQLEPGWHADHETPYSKGGATDIINGQALCPACNLKKGAGTSMATMELREFQKRFLDTALRIAKEGKKKTLVADVHAGSGKTLAACIAADQLMRAGYVQQVVVIVPRLNLAQQFELDWREARERLPEQPTMRQLYHRPNDSPLLLTGADGYVTTYSSLVANPTIHLKQIASKRTLIIFDEADRLGADSRANDFTVSARWSEAAANLAVFHFVMSGTPFRADGKPLLLAEYSEPDKDGFRKLLYDVSATYRDGVRDGYLRRFDFRLVNGVYTLRKFSGDDQKTFQESDGGISLILEDRRVYEPLVDSFVDGLREHKRSIDSRLCGLIAANTQAQAKKIQVYIAKKYPELRTLLAVSEDGPDAHLNLSKFKEGEHDVLITVEMAYIGYDYKPISVLLLLTATRSEAFLRQLVARGLRMWSEVPEAKQYCLAIAPDDLQMAAFVESLREESEWGYREREKREGPGPNYQPELAYVVDAWTTEMRAMGLDPMGDMSPQQLKRVEQAMVMKGVRFPAPDFWAVMLTVQELQQEPAPVITRQPKTMTEQIDRAKSELKDLARQCDYRLSETPKPNWGQTNLQLIKVYDGGTKGRSLPEIEQRIFTVQRWLKQGSYDERR